MKQTFILSTLAFLASCIAALPTPTVQDNALVDPRSIKKRAAITDAADVGYATQNGGHRTPFVAVISRLAVVSSSAAVIVVSGAISEAGKVKVTSNKSIIGKSGSCTYSSWWKEIFRGMADDVSTAALIGVTLTANGQSNIIVHILKISKDLADYGDAITIQASKN
ncbi:hypothetical protein diail_9882, partial [Diaporthe ilicicola]